MDAYPGGPKTYRSYLSGSGTLGLAISLPYPSGERGVFYKFKLFLPAVAGLEEGGGKSAPCGLYRMEGCVLCVGLSWSEGGWISHGVDVTVLDENILHFSTAVTSIPKCTVDPCQYQNVVPCRVILRSGKYGLAVKRITWDQRTEGERGAQDIRSTE